MEAVPFCLPVAGSTLVSASRGRATDYGYSEGLGSGSVRVGKGYEKAAISNNGYCNLSIVAISMAALRYFTWDTMRQGRMPASA